MQPMPKPKKGQCPIDSSKIPTKIGEMYPERVRNLMWRLGNMERDFLVWKKDFSDLINDWQERQDNET